MKKSLLKILFFSIISSHVFIAESLKALIPYYYLPETKSLQKEGLSIGKQAYQLLYFGQIKDSLNLAKLAVQINGTNETLWTILAETQIANNLYDDALISLNNAQKINPKMGETHIIGGFHSGFLSGKATKPYALIASGDEATKLFNQMIDVSILCISAEAVGAMTSAYLKTVQYTKEREQFSQPISNFQVLQHRMVDMFVETEITKSLLIKATLQLDSNDAEA